MLLLCYPSVLVIRPFVREGAVCDRSFNCDGSAGRQHEMLVGPAETSNNDSWRSTRKLEVVARTKLPAFAGAPPHAWELNWKEQSAATPELSTSASSASAHAKEGLGHCGRGGIATRFRYSSLGCQATCSMRRSTSDSCLLVYACRGS